MPDRSQRPDDAGSRGRLTAVICTRNRAERYLPAAIESVLPQLADGRHALLVVDNGSTDATRAVVGRYGPSVRYLSEPRVGLSHARNTGWRAAEHDAVAFLDDDAVAEPGWMAAALTGLAEGSDVGAVGGPVAPIWEAPRPAWLPDHLLGTVGVFEPGGGARDVDRLVGGNAAFRRSALEAIGGFSPRLGRQGARLIQGEDDAAFHGVREAGLRLRYRPEMAIRHHVPASRLTRRYLLRWGVGSGLGMARFSLDRYPSGWPRRGLWAWRELRAMTSPALLRRLGPGATPAERFGAVFVETRRAATLAAYLGLVE